MGLNIIIRDSSKRSDRDRERDNVVHVSDVKDHSFNQLTRDKTLVRMVRSGHGSDPGIKREALAIEQERDRNRKQHQITEKLVKIHQMRRQFGMKVDQPSGL